MRCELCQKPMPYKFKGYFAGIYFRPAHVKCIKQLEKETEQIKRETNLQRVKHNQELRVYQIKRLLDSEIYRQTVSLEKAERIASRVLLPQ